MIGNQGKVSSLLKVIASLLITVFLFSVFYATSLPQVSSLLETRYYQKAVTASILNQAEEEAKALSLYIKKEKETFAEYTLNSFVESYLSAVPSDIDTQMRSKVTGDLFTETSALLGFRFIDANGRYIHYSTFSKDTLSKTEKAVEYINYGDIKGELPFSQIVPFDTGIASRTQEELAERVKVVFDSETDKNGRIIFSVPFYDSLSVFRGFLVFYVAASDFPRYLIADKKLAFDTTFSLVSAQDGEREISGFLFGLPPFSSDANKALRILIEKAVSEKWKSGSDTVLQLNSVGEDDESWTLFSKESENKEKIGWVYKSDIFTLSTSLRLFFLSCACIVLYLIIFLIICLVFRDKMQLVRKRVKKLQFQIIKDYLEKKEKVDWSTIQESIQLQKNEFSLQIKESIGKVSKKKSKAIDELLEHSWNDILAVLGAPNASTKNVPFTLEQLRKMLSEVLSSVNERPVTVTMSPSVVKDLSDTPPAPVVKTVEELSDDVEEIEEAEAAEDGLEEVEELSDDVVEIEEAEEIEDVEALEELSDDVEEIEEISDDVEEAEAVEEIEEAESVEEVEELSDDVAEVDESEAVDTVEEIEKNEEVKEKKEAVAVEAKREEAERDKEETTEEYVASEFEREFDRETEDVRTAEKIAAESEAKTVVEDFSYEKPDFSFLDSSSDEEESVEDEPVSLVEPLDDDDETQYTFTLLRMIPEITQELSLESSEKVSREGAAIVEKDGVYVVSSNLDIDEKEKNESFMELVNSVRSSSEEIK